MVPKGESQAPLTSRTWSMRKLSIHNYLAIRSRKSHFLTVGLSFPSRKRPWAEWLVGVETAKIETIPESSLDLPVPAFTSE